MSVEIQELQIPKVDFSLIIRYAILVFFALVFFVPVLFMIISSLKPDLQLLRDTSSLRAIVPYGDISFNNYEGAYDRVPLFRFIFNSVFVTVVTVIIALFLNSMAAYSFAFLRWRGKELILSIIIATFIIPFETIAIPMLLLVSELPWISSEGVTTGWLDSYHVQIIPIYRGLVDDILVLSVF